MKNYKLAPADKIPLIVSLRDKKHYFALDDHGYLDHFIYENESWHSIKKNILGIQVAGFDAGTDNKGRVCLLGYDHKGNLFCLTDAEGEEKPEPFCLDGSKKICWISFCLDEEDHLHVFCLAVNEKREMWWIFYLCNEKGKWQTQSILDFGNYPGEQYGFISRDSEDHIYIMHRLFEEEKYSLVFRDLEKETKQPGRTIYLDVPQRDCFMPSFLTDGNNTLHVSWMSREKGIMFLNYTSKSSTGKWESYTSTEVPSESRPIAPIYLVEDRLLLFWENENILFHLYSLNNGKNWKWGRSKAVDTALELTRYHSTSNISDNPSRFGNFVFTVGKPPQEIVHPEQFTKIKEKERELSEEFHILEVLSSSLLTRTGNLQANNSYLEQKLSRQEKEMLKIYSWGITKAETLEEKLAAKDVELQKLDKLFKTTLKDLQRRLIREKEDIQLLNSALTKKTQELSVENKELKTRNFSLSQNIRELKEQVISLMKENEELINRKKSFFHKFFRIK
ncbi:MAG: hypothetical protein Q7J85_04975 [Bacillota bacterium]|nr:hypothetical protein [Bacillota bacterium]